MQRSKLLGTLCGQRKFSRGLYGPDLLKLCGAKGIRIVDLLDANESTCVFVDVDSVGSTREPLLSALVMLASDGVCRNYCGRTADGAGVRRERRRWLCEAA